MINVTKLKQQLKQGEIKNLYLFFGILGERTWHGNDSIYIGVWFCSLGIGPTDFGSVFLQSSGATGISSGWIPCD